MASIKFTDKKRRTRFSHTHDPIQNKQHF